MDFIRKNIPGIPPKEISPSDIGIGLRAGIIQSAIDAGFLEPDLNNNYDDKDLLRYSCLEGRQDRVEWLLKNCDFCNKRGNIKKELRSDFEWSLVRVLERGHHDIAARLFALGAKAGSHIHILLYHSIRKGWHEQAELLFAKGGEIKPDSRLKECIHHADERMKKIIEKGMLESIRRKFRR